MVRYDEALAILSFKLIFLSSRVYSVLLERIPYQVGWVYLF